MILFAAAGILGGAYALLYALHSFHRKKAPAGAGALLLMGLCILAAILLILC